MPSAAQCRGPSAGSRWRCRAGPWECRRRGFSSGATEIGHHVGNGGRRWRRRSPNCLPTIAGRTGRRGSPRPARHEWRVSKSTVATLMAETGVVARRKRRRRGTATPDKPPARRPTGCAAISPRTQRPDVPCAGFTETPTRRRQTPLATVLDLYSRRSYRYPTLDRALCPAHASVDPSAGHPPSRLRIQWSTLVVSTADEVRFGVHYGFGRWVRGGGCQCVVGRVRNTRRNLPI